MYVYPSQFMGRVASPMPFSHDGSDEYSTPKNNPEGDEAAFGFSDSTDILPPTAKAFGR
jgi:hypothetical protein